MFSTSKVAIKFLGAACPLAAPIFASTACAQMMTTPWKANVKATVEIRGYPGDNSCIQLYTPPSPYKMRVTDLTLDGYGSSTPIAYQYICTGTPVCSAARSSYMTAPKGSSLVQNWSTGILVNQGETLSVCNYGGIGKITSWTFHAILFTE